MGLWAKKYAMLVVFAKGILFRPCYFFSLWKVLNALICKADTWSLLKHLGVRSIPHQAWIYADDLVIFLSPVQQDLQLFQDIFTMLGGGLRIAVQHVKKLDGHYTL
jgi:hypothetical protein